MWILTALLVVAFVCIQFFVVSFTARRSQTYSSSERRHVCLVVLGDISRSPRMLYHARSLVEAGFRTSVVAYAPRTRGEPPVEGVEMVYITEGMGWTARLPRVAFVLVAPLKVLSMSLGLLLAITFRISSTPSVFLVQNPPAIPTLPLVKVVAFFNGSRVVIDWHNTAYSLLAVRLGTRHPVVRLTKRIESVFGRTADAHLLVSEAMKTKLLQEIGLKGPTIVFHDRPPRSFRPLESKERRNFLSSLDILRDPALKKFDLLARDAALLVSSTSWTADEDFGILLRALDEYETAASSRNVEVHLPRILVVITGKGAGKAAFEREVIEREKKWRYVRVRTAFLPRSDYPKLLGCADLGLSFHASSSGVDLPMKVVDMFGCGLPVCALNFASIDELVKVGENGEVFSSPTELSQLLITLLGGFPDYPRLGHLRDGISKMQKDGKWSSWEDHWTEKIKPILER